jgi:hypothetical protein
MIRCRVVTTLGRSVSAHGLWAISRSRTARAKMPCRTTWYLTTDRGDSPPSRAAVTQVWTSDGRIAESG